MPAIRDAKENPSVIVSSSQSKEWPSHLNCAKDDSHFQSAKQTANWQTRKWDVRVKLKSLTLQDYLQLWPETHLALKATYVIGEQTQCENEVGCSGLLACHIDYQLYFCKHNTMMSILWFSSFWWQNGFWWCRTTVLHVRVLSWTT